MAWCFALGSICFLIGPVPAYADLVGPTAGAATFFAGSVLFTAGGVLQVKAGGRRAARWAAISQSIGTVYFNVTTFRAMQVAVSSDTYDHRVWRPDVIGSSTATGISPGNRSWTGGPGTAFPPPTAGRVR
ncbi:hypothetical protein Acy02nite_60690 [Actinoplanes cyaneus]|uniref:Uncharacterized protein n=2 Tax=Actinoplanes cyaneus TaxID=52696 RepID=A0A919IRF5_9ACTN|nr:hypothetical protein [Actinoplanes cyaneus]GID68188.1 hypothetical protein Acy02nite_60690 [Actinoplanes cyaneus]